MLSSIGLSITFILCRRLFASRYDNLVVVVSLSSSCLSLILFGEVELRLLLSFRLVAAPGSDELRVVTVLLNKPASYIRSISSFAIGFLGSIALRFIGARELLDKLIVFIGLPKSLD